MLNFTLVPFIHSPYLKIAPILVNPLLIAATLSPLFYPSYYLYQPFINCLDLFIGLIVYNYLLYLQRNWTTASSIDNTVIPRFSENISLSFYTIFMLYWLYSAVIQFGYHNESIILIQLGNIFMSAAWYIYFSISAFLYYYICVKLEQRTESINKWLKQIKVESLILPEFYISYKIHRKAIKQFGRSWNFIVFMGFIILTYHIPIDLTNIIYSKVYTDITGFIIKLAALAWYVYKICKLNDSDKKIISYLYKHRIYSTTEITDIEKYATYHELGLNFYGIKIDGTLIIKVLLLTINLILPTIYAVVSNIIKI